MKKVNKLFATITVVLIAFAIIFGIVGSTKGALLVKTSGDPAVSVTSFFDAVVSKDEKGALQYLPNRRAITFDGTCESEYAQRFLSLLTSSYSYEIVGGINIDSIYAAQTVSFHCLDLKKVDKWVQTQISNSVWDIIKTHDSKEILDEEGMYLPIVYEEAFDKALTDFFSAVEDTTKTLDIYSDTEMICNLVYEGGDWVIDDDKEILTAIAGGLNYAIKEDTLNLVLAMDRFVDSSLAKASSGTEDGETLTIAEDATSAPAPDPTKYGTLSIEEAGQVENIIAYAKNIGLVEEGEVVFDPNVDFYYDSNIQYYCDSTILVICWKELIEGRICSCAEIKIADGSQIRRKLADDTYGSSSQTYASILAAQANAVVAMNADYYLFRNKGITVYNGILYRYETSCDVLFIDRNGDFILYRPDDSMSRDEMQEWITENNISFSIAFGPILIENSQVQDIDPYYAGGLGEIMQEYSRAALCQMGTRHYLYMAVSHAAQDGYPRCNVYEFANILATKNPISAYNFDGGQTGELVFQGVPFNHVDYGAERLVSDIIYFGTAIE